MSNIITEDMYDQCVAQLENILDKAEEVWEIYINYLRRINSYPYWYDSDMDRAEAYMIDDSWIHFRADSYENKYYYFQMPASYLWSKTWKDEWEANAVEAEQKRAAAALKKAQAEENLEKALYEQLKSKYEGSQS